jgi:hypothetical protein
MTLRDRLNLIQGNTMDGDHLIAIRQSMARAARLANDNRRRLAMLSEVVDDIILPPAPPQLPQLTSSPPYPHFVVLQASAMVPPRH